MAVSAMYPGTFDPITLGHEDLVRRAAKLFDKVVVAIADNPGSKAPMFTTAERVAMATAALADVDNVEVTGYAGLTVDYRAGQWAARHHSRFARRVRFRI